MTISIKVRDKIAVNVDRVEGVCGNSDYIIHFDFDEEWDAERAKTARFVYGGQYQDVVFNGTDVPMPVIYGATSVEVGCYAGDIRTTTPAVIYMARDITSGDPQHVEPSEDVYDQIMQAIEDGQLQGPPGDDYVLTEADKSEIAGQAAELVNVPTKLSQLEDDALHRTVTDAEKARWDAGGSGGTADHRELTNRDAANQHPISAIQGLQTALDGKQPAGSYATSAQLTAEASRASAAETALGARIDGLDIPTKVSDLTNDADYATSIEAQGFVSTETTRAQGAENNLQEQIDSIVSSSDVKDVVGTYAELQAYDTSTLGNNDIIKVLDDSTHSNARSYFRWQLPSETWDYIGSEGVGYTKAEADTLLNAKQDTISDLATIRTGAGKGDTAYQKPSSGIPKTDLASAVQTSLGKADSAYQKPSGGIPASDLASTTPVNEVSIDTTPTSGSSNLITSGGVYAALGNVESLLAAL